MGWRRLLWGLAAAIGAVLAARAILPTGHDASGADFVIASGSENKVLAPVVEEYCARRHFSCAFKYEGSLDIGLSLQPGRAAGVDAVWPAASLWIDMFDSGRQVKDLKSIAQSPVVFGVRMSKARELGWIGRDVTMTDIGAAVDAGRLTFLMTSATQSNSGASAYLAMLHAAVGRRKVLTAADLADRSVRDKVKSILKGVARSSGSSGWLAELYLDGVDKGAPYDAMWNYEAVLKETNDALKARGAELLYAVYPLDGVAVADSPLGFLDRGRGQKVADFFAGLQGYLGQPDVQARIAATGRRLPFGAAAGRPEPEWNFDPSRLVTVVAMPEPAIIRQALNLYQQGLRQPSWLAACLDFSGSMSGDGERQLKAALHQLFTPERAAELMIQWQPEDRIVLIAFDSNVRTVEAGSGGDDDQAMLDRAVAAMTAGGGTDMYRCAERALAEYGRERAGLSKVGHLPAIVLMTDGKSADNQARFFAQWDAAPVRVPVFGIAFGAADTRQLDALAAHTGGRVFDGRSDLSEAFRSLRGYN